MSSTGRIHVPLRMALSMIGRHARLKLLAQARSVAFIILYLAGFQMLVLREIPYPMLRIGAGIVMVVAGLTLFLEGLLVGLMPLGERVGLQLPRRCGLPMIMFFGLFLGIGVTLAEPAIAALRGMGQNVTAWDAPLLFMLLERFPEALVGAVGVGVGLAVAAGMARFYYGLSLKPFIYTIIPALLCLSAYCAHDKAMASILGLAWDTGAVTTGPVTVPLVLALGIGVSRSSPRRKNAGGGFGVIMLASAFPVLTVLVLGIALHFSMPGPVSESAFFSPPHRAEAMRFFRSDGDLYRHAFQRAGETSRRAVYGEDTAYRGAVLSLAGADGRRSLLGPMPLSEWLQRRASPEERRLLQTAVGSGMNVATGNTADAAGPIAAEESVKALKAVVPLSLLLLTALVVFLKARPGYWDETVFGIGMAVVGIAFLTGGIRIGLAPLGDQVGRPLPRMFRSEAREEGRLLIEGFDPATVQTAFAADGTRHPFFYMRGQDGAPVTIAFAPEQYDAKTGRYEHILSRPPLFGPQMTKIGIGLVLLFAFGLGYGSTLAEPALRALGRTVEDVSAGAIRSSGVVRAVSIGVGIGLIAGVVRILYGIPVFWMLAPPYLLVLLLTHWSEEDFASVAWDSGGVTTGVVTVPLVMAMGLGIGGALNVVDGFGILAMASVYPVLTVLLHGMMLRSRQRLAMRAMEENHANG